MCGSLKDFAPFLSAVAALFAAVAAILTWRTSRETRKAIRDGSVGTTLQWCNTRYVEIDEMRRRCDGIENAEEKVKEVKHYFERLWELHFIEYHFFLLGLLPMEVYSLWLWVRNREYRLDDKSVGGVSQAEGWKHANEYLKDGGFAMYIDDTVVKDRLKIGEIRAKLDEWMQRKRDD